jgi:polysaccharide biosynthesis/export protein
MAFRSVRRRVATWTLVRWLMAFAAAGAVGMGPVLAAAPVTTTGTYEVAPGDRITVTIAGQPDLSGEMPIDGAGNINLPLVGPIHVADLTVEHCEEVIRSRLASGYLVQPVVNVRLTDPRPIYVMGDVRTAGAYPFRYGGTVESAIASAGGYALAASAQSLIMSDYLQAEERLRQLEFERASLSLRQSRLEAQVEGQSSFPMPQVPGFVISGDIAAVVASEQATIASEAALVKAQVELLESQKPRLEAEIRATNAEIDTERGSLDLVRNEINRSGLLLKQGLSTRSPEVQLKLDEATQETDIWRLQADISRLERELGDLDVQIQDVQMSVRRQAIIDLATVRNRLAELAVLIPSALSMRDWKLQEVGGTTDLEPPHTMTITRTRGGVVAVMTASETSVLQPGDVIDVKRVLPKGALQGRVAAATQVTAE